MRYCILLFATTISFQSSGQFKNTSHEFIRYLLNNKMHDEATLVLNEKLHTAYSASSKDTLNYLLGKTYYSLQRLPESIQHFDLVSVENPSQFTEARLFSAFNEAYLKRYAKAQQKLTEFIPQEDNWRQLRNFELSGVYLLQYNFSAFDSIQPYIKSDWPAFQLQQQNFATYSKRLKSIKNKSPFVAGMLSTVVPGLGKVYAGRRGNGIYGFLLTGLLGAQTYEAYRKDGVKSARFIIYSTLFSSFYIGNIWGSALSVKVVKNEKHDAIREQILFDMHIPLRTIFQ